VILKPLSLVVQVVAVAVAVRTLQTDGFAVFVAVTALVSWMSIVSLGVAPALTFGIAQTSAAGDRQGEARLFAGTLALMAGVACLLLLVTLVLDRTGLIEQALGAWMDGDRVEARNAFVAMTLLMAAHLVLTVPEGAQLGYQSQFVTNVWMGIGSAATLVLLVVVGPSITSVTAFIAVSQGPQLVARVFNAATLLIGRPYLLQPRGIPLRSLVRPVIGSGMAFAGIQLASFLTQQFGVLVLVATATAPAVVLGGLILRGMAMASGIVTLVTTPTWPALTDAISRQDRGWARRAFVRIPAALMAYAVAVAIGILIGAEWALELWTGQQLSVELPLRILLAAYFVVGVWSHVYAMMLIGLGAIRFTALILLSEAAVVVAVQLVLIPAFGVTGYVAALLIGSLFVSAWVLPARARRELSRALEG
jgi:O-antigen/teichoic acid export membrane protein